MDLSIFLGQVLSVYFIVMGFALFVNKGEMLKAAQEFVGANASFVFYGAIALILGLLMILSHNIWDGTWRTIITFSGWAITMKGATAVLFPKVLKNTVNILLRGSITNIMGLLVIALGTYLALQVF
ncbi:MAG: hypothetical protein NUV96_00820 [Candidatus Colwellbacteria bacterium]|nr:hypothetical protein [Candidatus Colwellbacteria bacterium]